jgi:hypothetical protein
VALAGVPDHGGDSELGHSPQVMLGAYTHVINELRGAPRLPAEQETANAARELGPGSSGLCERP